MWPELRRRATGPELMDDPCNGGQELAEALGQLRVINAALGAAWPTVEGVARLWRRGGRPQSLTVLDVGAGTGDVSRALLPWAARAGVTLRLVLVDLHPETSAAAAAHNRAAPQVLVMCSNLLALGLGPVDIVISSLFTHHFADAELPAVYRAMAETARLGVVVNDLHRHPLAWAGIWLGTRLLSRNRMIRHDAPLSVQRGFTAAELRRLAALAGLDGAQVMWRPWFRYLVVAPGRACANNGAPAGDAMAEAGRLDLQVTSARAPTTAHAELERGSDGN